MGSKDLLKLIQPLADLALQLPAGVSDSEIVTVSWPSGQWHMQAGQLRDIRRAYERAHEHDTDLKLRTLGI
jgi:hypothetical protein